MSNITELPYPAVTSDPTRALVDPGQVVAASADQIIGGYSVVATVAALAAIPAALRKAGMRRKVLGDDGSGNFGRVFELAPDLATWLALGTQAEASGRVNSVLFRAFPSRSPYRDGWIDRNGYPVSATSAASGQLTGTAVGLTSFPVFPGRVAGPAIVDRNRRFVIQMAPVTAPPVTIRLAFPSRTGGAGTAIVDRNLRIISVVAGTSSTAIAAFVDNDGVYLDTGTRDIKIAAPVGTILAPPVVTATMLKWRDKWGGARERRQFLFAAWSPAAATNKLVMVPTIGQSLSVGYGSGALYTAAPVAPGRARMFGGGARPLGGGSWQHPGDSADVLADTQVSTLIDLAENLTGSFGETQCSGQAAWLTKAGIVEATSELLFGVLGLGGAPIGTISKGGQNYANLLRAIERAKAIADYRGLAFELPCIVFDQGESNYTATYAGYYAALAQLQADLTADVNAILGTVGQVRLVCWQPSSWTAAAAGGLAIAPDVVAILDLAIANPTKFAVIGPQYWSGFYNADGLHMASRGYRLLGEYGGRAVAALRAGGTTGALYATSAVYSAGSGVLTITFIAPPTIDTALVSAVAQNGLRLFSGATEIALGSIAVSGNTITCTPASAPTGGYLVGIADKGTPNAQSGPATGPRSNIRDASADLASDGTTNLYNWACTQQIPVTIN
jgi:hypothetical protein